MTGVTFADGTALSVDVSDPSAVVELWTLDGLTERQTVSTDTAQTVDRRPRLAVDVRRRVVHTRYARTYTTHIPATRRVIAHSYCLSCASGGVN